MRWIIDRFEEEFAVCAHIETDARKDVPLYALPAETKEGDVVVQSDSGLYRIDTAETEARHSNLRARMSNLIRKQ